MALEAPLPRLSLDIDDLLCTWEESGRGAIFSWDDPTTNSCAQLDLSDVQATMHTPRPGQMPNVNTYFGQQPPRQVGGLLLNQLAASAAQPFGVWGSGLPPIRSHPSPLLDMACGPIPEGNWHTQSSPFDLPNSTSTPDSRNHFCAGLPPRMLSDGGRQLSSKNSSCESWCVAPPELSQLPQMPMLPFLPMGLPPLQPGMLAQLQHQNALMSQQLSRMQSQLASREVVGNSPCNPAVAAGQYCMQLSPEQMLPVLELPAPTTAALAPRTPAARTRVAKGKAGPQSCSSSASTELGLVLTPSAAVLPGQPDLSCPTVSDGHSPQLQLQQANSGVTQLVAALEPGQQKQSTVSETAQRKHQGWKVELPVAIKVEPRSESRSSPCSSMGGVPAQQQGMGEEGRKSGSMLARPASQPHATNATTGSPEEFVRSRAEAVERYKHKRARRAYTKKIRYQLRKINADRRPRIKGRFVKKEEMHLYAHLFPPCATAHALEDAVAGLEGSMAHAGGEQGMEEEDMLMMDDIDIDGLDMDGDWGL